MVSSSSPGWACREVRTTSPEAASRVTEYPRSRILSGLSASSRPPAAETCSRIGDQIGDRHVDFVPYGADDGDPAIEDGAGHDFFVEGPQVFQAPAAAARDDDVDTGQEVHRSQRGGDLRRGALPLHGHGHDD